MKNSLFILFITLTSFFVRSQVSSYTFGTSTGTYTPIVGGSNYDNFTNWTNTNFLDDNNFFAFLILFTILIFSYLNRQFMPSKILDCKFYNLIYKSQFRYQSFHFYLFLLLA